jgi:hypothetical protein
MTFAEELWKSKSFLKKQWKELSDKLNILLPEEDATDAFWEQVKKNEKSLKELFQEFEHDETGWEIPENYKRCAVIYSYLYSDKLYRSDLLSRVSSIIPKDGKPWYAELECYTDSKRLLNGNPLFLGWLILFDGQAYASDAYPDLLSYIEKQI